MDLPSIDAHQPGRRSRDPHPFAIAEGAYQAMAFSRRSQSIVVLGDGYWTRPFFPPIFFSSLSNV